MEVALSRPFVCNAQDSTAVANAALTHYSLTSLEEDNELPTRIRRYARIISAVTSAFEQSRLAALQILADAPHVAQNAKLGNTSSEVSVERRERKVYCSCAEEETTDCSQGSLGSQGTVSSGSSGSSSQDGVHDGSYLHESSDMMAATRTVVKKC